MDRLDNIAENDQNWGSIREAWGLSAHAVQRNTLREDHSLWMNKNVWHLKEKWRVMRKKKWLKTKVSNSIQGDKR